jgi:hypothetical protein
MTHPYVLKLTDEEVNQLEDVLLRARDELIAMVAALAAPWL